MKEELINLDEAVINALQLFSQTKLPKLPKATTSTLILGSGNAHALGKLLYPQSIQANESTYKSTLKLHKPKNCIIISASAGKHSISITKYLKRKKIPTTLLTNNPDGKATKYSDQTIIFPKLAEPYTYNISTYLAMILAKTNETPKTILTFLKKTKVPNLKKYNSFFFILPEKFDSLREFYETKFDELFGPKILGRAFTFEETKHAKTVIKSEKELFVSLGKENKIFGKHKLNYKIPKSANFGLAFCLGYYIIGKIQSQNPPYFKKSISSYVKKASKLFGQKIKIQS